MSNTAVTPVVIPDSDSSTEIPTSWVLAYLAIALVVWLAVAVAFTRHETARGEQPTSENMVMGVVFGLVGAATWPLAIIGVVVWLAVRRLTHGPRSNKEH